MDRLKVRISALLWMIAMWGAIGSLRLLIDGFSIISEQAESVQEWGLLDYLFRDLTFEVTIATFESLSALLRAFLLPIPIAVIPYCLASSFDNIFNVDKRDFPQGWWWFATTLRGKIIETAVFLTIVLIILSWLF